MLVTAETLASFEVKGAAQDASPNFRAGASSPWASPAEFNNKEAKSAGFFSDSPFGLMTSTGLEFASSTAFLISGVMTVPLLSKAFR